MQFRSVQIKGQLKRVTEAIGIIYDCLERQAHSVEDFQGKTATPINKEKLKITAKYVVHDEAQGFLIGRHGAFTKCMSENGIYMKCFKDHHNRALRKSEAICSMAGFMSDIEHGTNELIKRLESFYETQHKSFNDFSLSLLIPSNLVTKLIGAGGCLIKELVTRTGCNIRVQSDKNAPFTQETVVTCDGNNKQKRAGATAILEKVELFKNGGPVSKVFVNSG